MENYKRTHTCGELRGADADTGKEVTLNGWVHRKRDHGSIQFITLRDRYGITQAVIDDDAPSETAETAAKLKLEYCIAVKGQVRKRPHSMKNPHMSTGAIEIQVSHIEILGTSEVLPFMVDERSEAHDELRMKYRYIDLRSFAMQRNIQLRADVCRHAREYLTKHHFLEIETPTMIRSTPEGARDFLIPSRMNRGKFYAMPQSPQLFKQLLMVSGFDRYFQLAHCFRDEDLRGDRQPEHTQIDIEMSFVDQEDIFALSEGLMKHLFERCLGITLQTPFPRITYDDAMNRYGSDKPDLRFNMQLQDFSSYIPGSGFGIFESALKTGGSVKLLIAPGASAYSRKQISELEEIAKIYGAKGLAWTRVCGHNADAADGDGDGDSADGDAGRKYFDGGIGKFFSEQAGEICSATGAKPGDLLLFVADSWKTACTALGAVRKHLGSLNLPSAPSTAASAPANTPASAHTPVASASTVPPPAFSFAWIVDFPLFEYNGDRQAWDATHHLFTMPQKQFLETMEQEPGAVKGSLYDLVCNGVELASGSIRIHDPEIQQRIFTIVGMDREEAERRFGFLLRAFQYGAPPHGGIAPGLDRLVALMAGESSIREVIAFPKNTAGINPLDNSPSPVDNEQLTELGLSIIE